MLMHVRLFISLALLFDRTMTAHRRSLERLWKISTNHLCQSTQLFQLRILLTRMTGSTMLRWLVRLEPMYKLLVMISWLPTPRSVHYMNFFIFWVILERLPSDLLLFCCVHRGFRRQLTQKHAMLFCSRYSFYWQIFSAEKLLDLGR